MIMSIPGMGLIGTGLRSMGRADDSEDDDPVALGRAMRAALEVMRAAVEATMGVEQPVQVPPASELLRDALPRVVVTKEDQQDPSNSSCSVCLEDYRIGARVTRMLCGHLFCTNCIREWLRSANSCPVCRFELATDNEDFETGRAERMQGRRMVLKSGELSMMRVPDLKKLMRALGVSCEGCVEKCDLIKRLGEAPAMDIASDRKDLRYVESDLGDLEITLVRNLMERHNMPKLPNDMNEIVERAEALKCFRASGWMEAIGISGSAGSAHRPASGQRCKPGDTATDVSACGEPPLSLNDTSSSTIMGTSASDESLDASFMDCSNEPPVAAAVVPSRVARQGSRGPECHAKRSAQEPEGGEKKARGSSSDKHRRRRTAGECKEADLDEAIEALATSASSSSGSHSQALKNPKEEAQLDDGLADRAPPAEADNSAPGPRAKARAPADGAPRHGRAAVRRSESLSVAPRSGSHVTAAASSSSSSSMAAAAPVSGVSNDRGRAVQSRGSTTRSATVAGGPITPTRPAGRAPSVVRPRPRGERVITVPSSSQGGSGSVS